MLVLFTGWFSMPSAHTADAAAAARTCVREHVIALLVSSYTLSLLDAPRAARFAHQLHALLQRAGYGGNVRQS